jgi:hypothetical protein
MKRFIGKYQKQYGRREIKERKAEASTNIKVESKKNVMVPKKPESPPKFKEIKVDATEVEE